MIKKLNTLLIVFVVVLFAAKIVKDKVQERSAEVHAAPSAKASVRNPDLAINVYYETWGPFVLPNPVTRRNGIVLDIVRAIFPKARFIRAKDDLPSLELMLRDDPLGVVVNEGRTPALADYEAAPTPLATDKIAVYTLRTNEWTYAGVASLEKLRLMYSPDCLDSAVVRDFHARHANDPAHAVLIQRNDDAYADPLDALLEGRADAFVESVSLYSPDRAMGVSSDSIIRLRSSTSIDEVRLLFTPSKCDPKMQRRLIEAYEKGYQEIKASGELRRILEYYGLKKIEE